MVNEDLFNCLEKEPNLLQAILEQHLLGMLALEKGYTSKMWVIMQEEWHNSHGSNRSFSGIWQKKFIMALHKYTYNLWKKRNTFIHGEELKGNRKRQHKLCKERVSQLYAMDRSILSQKEREVFKLPLSIRHKQGLEGIALWINTTETIFDVALRCSGSKLEHPMFS